MSGLTPIGRAPGPRPGPARPGRDGPAPPAGGAAPGRETPHGPGRRPAV